MKLSEELLRYKGCKLDKCATCTKGENFKSQQTHSPNRGLINEQLRTRFFFFFFLKRLKDAKKNFICEA